MRSEHRWPAAPRQRVIETRKIVMNQRGAVHQLDGSATSSGQGQIFGATCLCHREGQVRTDTSATGKHSIPHRSRQKRRTLGALLKGERSL
jgi:hypothetical protein